MLAGNIFRHCLGGQRRIGRVFLRARLDDESHPWSTRHNAPGTLHRDAPAVMFTYRKCVGHCSIVWTEFHRKNVKTRLGCPAGMLLLQRWKDGCTSCRDNSAGTSFASAASMSISLLCKDGKNVRVATQTFCCSCDTKHCRNNWDAISARTSFAGVTTWTSSRTFKREFQKRHEKFTASAKKVNLLQRRTPTVSRPAECEGIHQQHQGLPIMTTHHNRIKAYLLRKFDELYDISDSFLSIRILQ